MTAELAAGIRPLESSEDNPAEEDDGVEDPEHWLFSVEVASSEVEGVLDVRVTVRASSESPRQVEYSLARWMLEPEKRGRGAGGRGAGGRGVGGRGGRRMTNAQGNCPPRARVARMTNDQAPMTKSPTPRGFTLLEVILAAGLTAVILLIIASGIDVQWRAFRGQSGPRPNTPSSPACLRTALPTICAAYCLRAPERRR